MARWKYRLIAGLQLIGLLIFAKVFLGLLLNPTCMRVVLWGIIVLGCAQVRLDHHFSLVSSGEGRDSDCRVSSKYSWG